MTGRRPVFTRGPAVVGWLLLVIAWETGPARLVAPAMGAENGGPPKPSKEPSKDPSPSKAAEANRHFQRAVELYDDGDTAAALVEFSRSYQIVPSFKVLYNLGQLSYERQDYVAALGHFRRYLADGGDQVGADRRRQVEQDIRRLELRIGRIEIDARENGAEIFLDDVSVGKAPLPEPIVANVGRRKVELVSRLGLRQTRWTDVPGGETAHVRFDVASVGAAPVPAASASAAPTPGLAVGARVGLPGPSAVLETTPPRNLISKPALPPTAAEDRDDAPHPRRGKWLAWTAAGLLAAGAVTTGAFAFSASRDLQQTRDRYPIAPDELEEGGRRARVLAWTTDGLLVGTALMTAWAVYLSATDGPAPPSSHRARAAGDDHAHDNDRY